MELYTLFGLLNKPEFVQAIIYCSEQLHIYQDFCPYTVNFLSWALNMTKGLRNLDIQLISNNFTKGYR